MWLLERCRKEWETTNNQYSYTELIDAALAAPAFRSLINPMPMFPKSGIHDQGYRRILQTDRLNLSPKHTEK